MLSSVDSDGFVVATAQCPAPPHPYSIIESSRFPGRFYFFNSNTRVSQWRIEPWRVEEDAVEACCGVTATSPRTDPLPSKTPPRRRDATPLLEPEGLTVVGGSGHGGFGVVVRVVHEVQGRPRQFAMKCMSKSLRPAASRQKGQEQIERELESFAKVPLSPFLVRHYLKFESPSTVFCVMDLAGGGDLFYHLDVVTVHGDSGFPTAQARVLLAETAVGLCHMHDHGLIHRDVKVENVMLTTEGHVKLVDYGLCCEVKNEDGIHVRTAGSLIYQSPENLREGLVGRFSDWWALGVLGYELLTARSPWSTLSEIEQVKWEIMNDPVTAPILDVHESASELIAALMRHNQTSRLGTAVSRDVLSHRFFTEALDMAAVERGETPPAIVLDAGTADYAAVDEVVERDREDALRKYDELSKLSPDEWSLGLTQVKEHPPCPRPRKL